MEPPLRKALFILIFGLFGDRNSMKIPEIDYHKISVGAHVKSMAVSSTNMESAEHDSATLPTIHQ